MSTESGSPTWQGSDAYDAYMGRWSRPMAQAFLGWFAAPKHGRWLDIGCGTGALTEAVLAEADPIAVTGIDSSSEYVNNAAARISDPRARFEVGDAHDLPVDAESYDSAVAGLVLNHVSEPAAAIESMVQAVRPGGVVGAYVWDYDGGMQLVRYCWDAGVVVVGETPSPDPRGHPEICQPEALAAVFRSAGLGEVVVDAIDLPMVFRDFDDYWIPHTLSGSAAMQRYVRSLRDDQRDELRERLRETLPVAPDGSIPLIGRAWAIKGSK